jgi:hypothetical protein
MPWNAEMRPVSGAVIGSARLRDPTANTFKHPLIVLSLEREHAPAPSTPSEPFGEGRANAIKVLANKPYGDLTGAEFAPLQDHLVAFKPLADEGLEG